MSEATPGVDLTGKLQILAFANFIISIAANFTWRILSRRKNFYSGKGGVAESFGDLLQATSPNCGRYFLLTAGYNTCYCNNIPPGEAERTCRKVGAHRMEAQGIANRTPAQADYHRAYGRLKARKRRRKISADEWNTAVAQAQELMAQSERGELTDEELARKLNQL